MFIGIQLIINQNSKIEYTSMKIRDKILPVLGPKGGKEEIKALTEIVNRKFHMQI